MAAIKGLNFKVSATASGVGALTSFTRAVSGIAVAGKQAQSALGNWTSMMRSLKSEFNPAAAATDALTDKMNRLKLAQQLGVVSAEQYQQQLFDMKNAMQSVTTEANRLTPATNSLGAAIDNHNRSVGSWNRGLKDTNRAIQQAGFQVGDFFIQVAGGQNIVLAFTQQAGQLIQFFGMWGSLAAAAIAIGGALWMMFGKGEDATKKAADALNAWDSALQGTLTNVTLANTSVADLAKTYGQFADEVHRAAQESMSFDLSKSLGALRQGAMDATVSLQGIKAEEQQLLQYQNDIANGVFVDINVVNDQKQKIADMSNALGMSVDQADALYLAIGKFNGGGTFAQMRDNAQSVVDMLGQMYAGSSTIPPEITKMRDEYLKTLDTLDQIVAVQDGSATAAQNAASATATITGEMKGVSGWAQMANANIAGAAQSADDLANTNMASAVASAAGWAQSLWQRLAGAAAAARAVASLQDKRLGDLNAGMMGRAGAPGQGASRDYSLDAWKVMVPDVGGGGGGGGGGGESPIAKLQREYADLVKELDPAVTATTAFTDANKRMMDAFKTGNADAIQGTFDKMKPVIEDIKRAFEDLTSSISQSMMSSFLAVVKRTETLADGIKSILGTIIDKMITMLMSPVFDGIAGFLGKSIFGAIGVLPGLPSFAGGGSTGNGSRSGGLDGKGGFLSVMHPKESVTDHTRSGSGRDGGASMIINVTVNGATGNNEIADMVNRGVTAGLQYYCLLYTSPSPRDA